MPSLNIVSAAFRINSSGSDNPFIGANRAYSAYTQGNYWARAKITLPVPASSITVKFKMNSVEAGSVGTSTVYYLGLSQYMVTGHEYGVAMMPSSTTQNYKGSGKTFYVKSWNFSTSGYKTMTINAAAGSVLMPGDWYLYAYDRHSGETSAYLIRNGDSRSAAYPWTVSGNPSYVAGGGLVRLDIGGEIKSAIPYVCTNGELKQVLPYVNDGGTLEIGV